MNNDNDKARTLLEALFDAIVCDADGQYFICSENEALIEEVGAFLFEEVLI